MGGKNKKEKEKKDHVDELKRRLLKLGVYTAPTVVIIPISAIRAKAETPIEICGPDLPAPVFRRKGEGGSESEKEKVKIKRLRPLSETPQRNPLEGKSPWKNPFPKSPFQGSRTKEKGGEEGKD